MFVLDLASGRTTPLATGNETFDGLAWDESGTRLAALHGVAPEKMKYRANALSIFTGVDGAKPARIDLAASTAQNVRRRPAPYIFGALGLVAIGVGAALLANPKTRAAGGKLAKSAWEMYRDRKA